jgi:hypothetical protein
VTTVECELESRNNSMFAHGKSKERLNSLIRQRIVVCVVFGVWLLLDRKVITVVGWFVPLHMFLGVCEFVELKNLERESEGNEL